MVKSRAKGVPQNFGYIKRSNGSATATEMQTSAMMNGGRTAHVSAVPRSNKLKVSGGTQTGNGEFPQSECVFAKTVIKSHFSSFSESNIQFKSYSLTGQNAAQLSQSVKDRFANGTNSLPKSSLDMHVFQARLALRF
jgi:neuron navigator 2